MLIAMRAFSGGRGAGEIPSPLPVIVPLDVPQGPLLPGLPGDTNGLPGVLAGQQNPEQVAGVDQSLLQIEQTRMALSGSLPQLRHLALAIMGLFIRDPELQAPLPGG